MPTTTFFFLVFKFSC